MGSFMMIYNLDDDGNVIYNWNYVDDLFDFFMEVNVKPFIELGFMPSELKSEDKNIYIGGKPMFPSQRISIYGQN